MATHTDRGAGFAPGDGRGPTNPFALWNAHTTAVPATRIATNQLTQRAPPCYIGTFVVIATVNDVHVGTHLLIVPR